MFHNEIFNPRKVVELVDTLTKLREFSIDGNPVSAKVELKYEIILTARSLALLDDEPI